MNPDTYFNLAAEHFGYLHESEIAKQDREVIALADFLRTKFAPVIDAARDSAKAITASHGDDGSSIEDENALVAAVAKFDALEN